MVINHFPIHESGAHPPSSRSNTVPSQEAEPNLKAWLVSGSRASVLTQALSNLTILPAGWVENNP